MDTNSKRGSPSTRPLLLGGGLALLSALLGALGASLGGALGALLAIVVAAAAGAFVLGRFGASIFGGNTLAPAESRPKPSAAAPVADAIPQDRIDTLTGLANENGLLAWFAEKQGRLAEDSKGIVVLVANLDAFEELARTRGKTMADSVLVEVAKRVSTFSGEDGIAARVAGDEIMAVATVVPDHALEYAEERAGSMAETICRPAELASGALWIGGSVGAAVGRPSEGEGVFTRAREALKKAQRLGQGRYIVDPGK